MFGFGKKKKMINQFITMIQSVMGTYMIMRSISSHRFEETKLDSLGIQILEACYILGIIDCIGAAIDLEGRIIDQKLIIEACEDCSISRGNAVHKRG